MYGDSHALSSDSRPIILFSSNSTPKLEELFMESDSNYTNNSSGLLRYRSAPTSLLSNFAEKSADFSSRICSSDDNKEADNIDNNNMNLFEENDGKYNRFSTIMNSNNNNNSQLPPQYPRQMGSFCVDSWSHQEKIGSNLARQNSSPAGLMFSQNGYAGVMRSGVGRNYRMVDNGAIGELSDLNSNLNSCGTILPSSLGPLSRISEVEHESCDDHEKVGNDSLFFSSWNDSSHNFAENAFTGGIKRELQDDDQKLFQSGNRPYSLSHHLSLPKNSADHQMAAMEKLLQLQDTVPCKIRAKRGCATHPRSIAERVRRTRISERMRKLQELVPNMDKQTNTADMLDLAVDYIKNLQRQYKMLNDNRANCKCAASQKANLNQTH